MKNLISKAIEVLWNMPVFVLCTFFIFSISSLIIFLSTKNMLNSFVALMTIPSIIAIIYLTPKAKEEVVKFNERNPRT